MKKLAFPMLAAMSFGFVVAAPFAARADVEAGMLTCRSVQPSNFVVVSSQTYNCLFAPATGGPPQRYEATIHRFGAQIGVSEDAQLGWAVFAATPRVRPGALAGGYGGVSAGATVGVGGNANGLVGGLDNSFALQPVSLEGQTGLNVVATVTSLDLRSVAPARHRHRRHHH
ncbi:MAG TPA: DUF992 domain-containing protein [Pseudolabrys sp.]|nr:DUF992 domain-containing protein [Pseudolabrys sp.]